MVSHNSSKLSSQHASSVPKSSDGVSMVPISTLATVKSTSAPSFLKARSDYLHRLWWCCAACSWWRCWASAQWPLCFGAECHALWCGWQLTCRSNHKSASCAMVRITCSTVRMDTFAVKCYLKEAVKVHEVFMFLMVFVCILRKHLLPRSGREIAFCAMFSATFSLFSGCNCCLTEEAMKTKITATRARKQRHSWIWTDPFFFLEQIFCSNRSSRSKPGPCRVQVRSGQVMCFRFFVFFIILPEPSTETNEKQKKK